MIDTIINAELKITTPDAFSFNRFCNMIFSKETRASECLRTGDTLDGFVIINTEPIFDDAQVLTTQMYYTLDYKEHDPKDVIDHLIDKGYMLIDLEW